MWALVMIMGNNLTRTSTLGDHCPDACTIKTPTDAALFKHVAHFYRTMGSGRFICDASMRAELVHEMHLKLYMAEADAEAAEHVSHFVQ